MSCLVIAGCGRAHDADTGQADTVVDADGDGASSDVDCDDHDPDVHPGATEVCDDAGIDEDCDGLVNGADDDLDPDSASTWYVDGDGDGYGASDDPGGQHCDNPSEAGAYYTTDNTDCDDDEHDTHPGAPEVCDGVDDDCDGLIDDADPDVDSCASAGEIAIDALDVVAFGPASARFGFGAGLGDLDGDGHTDLVVGAYQEDDGDGGASAGETWVVYGPLSGTIALPGDAAATWQGADAYDYSGKVIEVGDVTGDGVDDMLVSAFSADTPGTGVGRVYLVEGSTTRASGTSSWDDGAARTWVGETDYDYLGTSVRIVGDVTGDGLPDLALGAYGEDTGGSSAGAVYVLAGPVSASGAEDLVGDAADTLVAGAEIGDNLGYYGQVARAIDFDGDGASDLALGAWYADGGGSASGAAYVLAGPLTGGTISVGDADVTVLGTMSYDYLGDATASVGDVDGDGYDDLALGADCFDGAAGQSTGAIFVLFGSPSWGVISAPVDTVAGARLEGAVAYDYLGTDITGLDLDDDGQSDLAAGASGADPVAGSGYGAAYVWSGPIAGTLTTASARVTIAGDASGSEAGRLLIGADSDDDGVDDLLVSAYESDLLGILFGG